MNFLFKTLISFTAFIVASHVLAAQEDCPPVTLIANTTFIQANSAIDDSRPFPYVWVMLSNDFNYQNQKWNVVFVATLENPKSDSEALGQGQNYFKRITLHEPDATLWDGWSMCTYGFWQNEQGGYAVYASNPPYQGHMQQPSKMPKLH